jgi:hypothetical protein
VIRPLPAKDDLPQHPWRAVAARAAQVKPMKTGRKPRADAQKDAVSGNGPCADLSILGDSMGPGRATWARGFKP